MSKPADWSSYSAGRKTAATMLPPVIKAIMRRDWHGQEHIPAEGGVILAANHLSYVDWAAVALFAYEAGRYPNFLIKASVFDVKLLGPMLLSLGQLPVHRGMADAALVLKEAEAGLREGACIIFYPEGTATRDPDLWPMVAKTGVARLALSTRTPVVPIANWGAQVILPYGSKKPHLIPRHTVQMLAGPPVDLSAYDGQPLSREVLRAATDTIMADIAGLLARIRGERAPAAPFDPVAARRAAQQPGGQTPQPAGGQPDQVMPP